MGTITQIKVVLLTTRVFARYLNLVLLSVFLWLYNVFVRVSAVVSAADTLVNVTNVINHLGKWRSQA